VITKFADLFDGTLGHLEGDVHLGVDTDVAPYTDAVTSSTPSRYEIESKQSFGGWSKLDDVSTPIAVGVGAACRHEATKRHPDLH